MTAACVKPEEPWRGWERWKDAGLQRAIQGTAGQKADAAKQPKRGPSQQRQPHQRHRERRTPHQRRYRPAAGSVFQHGPALLAEPANRVRHAHGHAQQPRQNCTPHPGVSACGSDFGGLMVRRLAASRSIHQKISPHRSPQLKSQLLN